MKKNEFMQIKGLDVKELSLKSKVLREEIANLTLDKNMKKLKDLKIISKKKKELARILTVIRQKELLTQLESRVQKEDSSNPVIARSETTKQSSASINKIATLPVRQAGLIARNDKGKGNKKI